MILTNKQILLLLDRLKWEVAYSDGVIMVVKKRVIGYSQDKEIAQIEASLSIMLEANSRNKGAS